MKTTIQILYDRGLFDNFQNAEEVLKDFLFVTRRDSWYLQLYEYLYQGILTIIRAFIHMFHNCDNIIIRVLILGKYLQLYE